MLVRIRKNLLLLLTMLFLLTGAVVTSVIVYADSYHTIRINYYYVDGTPAHDPYIATYMASDDPLNLEVKNPSITGYDPMTATDGTGLSAETSTISLEHIDHNVELNVYYIAGLSTYRVMYYKQNIYDDLYTRDNSISSEYTNRRGKTGTNPTVLETETLLGYEGFTNLFHEPDSIAADGSTVFRVYYDRNYYHILFDLGDGGYGVEPVYSKYQSVYHISEPKRSGYTFLGWARTDKDSSQSNDWHYIDSNGDVITEEQALANPVSLNGDQTVPAENTYYKALWEKGTTSYSVVYWIQNPDGKSITEDEINATANMTQARTLIAQNYSVVVARDINNVQSGTMVNLNTIIQNARGQDMELYDLFAYDLSNTTNFPMSDAMRAELVDKEKYYEFNSYLSNLQFNGPHEEDPHKTHIEVMGDGTTRINVYYNRKDFTLKFYYARQKLNNGVANGAIDLTNSTKNFSNNDYYNKTNKTYLDALSSGTWQSNIADSLPQIKSDLLVENGGPLTPGYNDFNGYRYYYYQISAKYNAPLTDKWRIDAITPVHKKGYADEQICYPGSWAVENGTYFYNSHKSVNNFTVKGVYERLGDELMFSTDKVTNYQELHYLLSWTNTATSSGWNYGISNVLHFTYENYVELLPREVDVMTHDGNDDGNPDGVNGLINEGLYVNVYELRNNTFTWIDHNQPFVYHDDAVYYGLKEDYVIETTDSGSQYPINDYNKKTAYVRSDQVPTELTGYKLINADNKNSNGQIILDSTNTIVDWSDDTSSYRHALVKFFYNRREYSLKWRNGNRLEEDRTRSVKYGAPLNSYYRDAEDGHEAGEYRYWYNGSPVYFNADLRDYYNFEGWYYTPYYYRLVDKDTATMPADDLTFYAKWVPNTIKVSFYPTYNDYYENENRIGDEITVDYGDYVPHELIPANVEGDDRPKLNPPATGAMFAGWYYLRDNIPVRFEPENLPVTALNRESSGKNATFHLYAEWVTKEVGKYKVKYVEKNNTGNEVADPTTGRAFVWKTRTFNAKGGSQLNDAHAWQEDGINWWPVVNSHSLVIKANDHTKSDYSPNEYTFEYIQKTGVWYRVQYLDATTHAPLADPIEAYTTNASVKADSLFIPDYVAEDMSKTLVLSASEKTGDAAKEEELENNVINFYYNKNDSAYLYEVEYYGQNVGDDNYELIQSENIEVPIADDPETKEVEPTTVALSDIYNRHYAQIFAVNGFTRVAGATKQVVTNSDGTSVTTDLSDNDSFTVTSDKKTTIRVYFNRKTYSYTYRYVDYHAERKYLDTDESQREGMWDGVMETHNSSSNERVEKEVTIPAPSELTYDSKPYIRVSENDVVLTIAPDENNPDVNVINVYYKKFNERELQYKLVCKDSQYNELDYDNTKNPPQPLYGGLSSTAQTVDTYSEIQNVNFYDFNDAIDPTLDESLPLTDRYLHNHRYNFLGWYDNPEGTGTPLSADAELTPAEMVGDTEELPARNSTYYAVVEQVMVHANFEFRTVEQELPIGGDSGETEEDRQAAEIVRNAPIDTDGSKTGKYFNFTAPSNYKSGDPTPWERSAGYNLTVEPKDDRVYKYEFAEWWEEDLTPGENYGKLIRKKNWNSDGEWSPTVLQQVLDRQGDKHIIAVYKRRTVNEMPYTIKYRFKTRTNGVKDFVVKGTLNADQLNEQHTDVCINNSGCFELTDEFIMSKAPFESNHGETLLWKDTNIEKTSAKGNASAEKESERADRIITTVTAEQTVKTVHVNYKTTPDSAYQSIEVPVGADREICEDMRKIDARGKEYDGKEFSYWEIRKDEDGEVIAKSYHPWFDFCVMDNYWVTPVFDGKKTPESDPDYDSIKLRHIDYTRNRWTDEEGALYPNGATDLLFTNFEISFNNKDKKIYGDDSTYKTGVVFELCAALPSGKTFTEGRDYGFATDTTNLTEKILDAVDKGYTNTTYVYNPAKNKSRSIMVKPIPTGNLTNKNRVMFGQSYVNNYVLSYDNEDNPVYTFKNSTYVLKATAYLIDENNNVSLSNSVYTCLDEISKKELATGDMKVFTSGD